MSKRQKKVRSGTSSQFSRAMAAIATHIGHRREQSPRMLLRQAVLDGSSMGLALYVTLFLAAWPGQDGGNSAPVRWSQLLVIGIAVLAMVVIATALGCWRSSRDAQTHEFAYAACAVSVSLSIASFGDVMLFHTGLITAPAQVLVAGAISIAVILMERVAMMYLADFSRERPRPVHAPARNVVPDRRPLSHQAHPLFAPRNDAVTMGTQVSRSAFSTSPSRTSTTLPVVRSQSTSYDAALTHRPSAASMRSGHLAPLAAPTEPAASIVDFERDLDEWSNITQPFPLPRRATNSTSRSIKRLLDIGVSLTALLVFSPLMLILALLVKLESRGPALFVQQRVGQDGKTFDLLKFRSMRADAEVSTGPVFAKPNDPRCTCIGRFMRRHSLDELPQLINVLRGDMSIVGPRPERPYFVARFSENIPHYAERHREKAGITGWAQINGRRGDTSIEERVLYDLYYVEHWSLALDIRIMVRTIVEILQGHNAY